MRTWYWLTSFLSAALLFLIQPVLAKALLPVFGGAASVWTTALCFFQLVLLLGYLWAFALSRMPPRAARLFHAALLLGSVVLLPVSPRVQAGSNPMLQVLSTLLVSAGLPCFLLSATSPLLQSWYSGRFAGAIPWRVFAISNVASLAGLLAYPLVLEPLVGNAAMLRGWSFGYALFALLCVVAAIAGPFSRESSAQKVTRDAALVWLALAFAPSALWMAVVSYLSQSVAPVPLLWILPLTIYLVSFAWCFSAISPYDAQRMRWLLPAGIIAVVAGMRWHTWSASLLPALVLFGAGLFVCCIFCHGQLYERRPAPAQLTYFYLIVALGGALGAAFVSLAAPSLFRGMTELPVAVGVTALLGLALVYRYPARRLIRTGLLLIAAFFVANAIDTDAAVSARNFYGAIQVRDNGSGLDRQRMLYNGSTLHGVQFTDPSRSQEPTAYYAKDSGVGLILNGLTKNARRVGIIGLGAGTLAAYGRAGDTFRFYELNPLVIDIARKDFKFLHDTAAHVEVIEGDARLQLAREPLQNYDVLVVDAFSGDAVPVHLLTTQAFALYEKQLAPDGVLLLHVTNRYLNLASLAVRTAHATGHKAQTLYSAAAPARGVTDAVWVIVAGDTAAIPNAKVWTDDRSDLLSVLR